MSTHYIEEAERLADDVAVMSAGRVIARGNPADLLTKHAGTDALELYGQPQRLTEIEDLVARAGGATRRTGPSISLLRAESAPTELLERIDPHEQGLRRRTTLEDVFVLLTGEELE
jgi:lipooligosaccharide transport system ATP-binding protein